MGNGAIGRFGASRFAVVVMSCIVAVLVMIGVAAAIGRGVFPADWAIRADAFRTPLLHFFHSYEPFIQNRPEELNQFDVRYAAHPVVTLLHVLPGSIFLVMALFQFSSRIRNRHIRFHRWSGRVLVFDGFIMGLTALYFGLLMPFGGLGEATAIALFGGFFLICISRAFIAIRKHQVAAHREWMIRAFAVVISISTARIAMTVLDVLLTPAGFRPKVLFVLGLWAGWVITIGAAEFWIRYTRRRTAYPLSFVNWDNKHGNTEDTERKHIQ